MTVSLDSVTFVNKVHVGDVLLLAGRLNAAFGSSMEVEVMVHAEDPLSGTRRLTTCALVTMVAVDGKGRPRKTLGLEARNDDDRRRAGIRNVLEKNVSSSADILPNSGIDGDTDH